MMTDHEIAALLDLHVRLLAQDGPEAADRLAQSAAPAAAGLMELAARVFQALPEVTPDPAFRANLAHGLALAAGRAGAPWRPSSLRRRFGRAAQRHRTVAMMAGGAAVAVLSVAVVWLAERDTRPVAG